MGEVTETQRAGHAWTIGNEVDLSTVDAFIIVGGDGLMHEFVNGLLSRPELPAGDLLPALGLLPAGSANGLAKSLSESSGLPCTPMALMFLAAKGNRVPIDLQMYSPVTDVGVEREGELMGLPDCQQQQRRYSFLSLTWGMIADIDIESERCRCCGPLRFDCEAICKILNRRSYRGKLVYKLDEGSPAVSVEGPFTTVLAANVAWIAEDTRLNPKASLADGKIDLLIVKEAGRCELLDLFGDMESGVHLESPLVQNLQVSSFTLVPEACDDGCCCWWSMICCCCCPTVRADTGHMVVDGEEVVYEGMQCSLLPSRLQVFHLPAAATEHEKDGSDAEDTPLL